MAFFGVEFGAEAGEGSGGFRGFMGGASDTFAGAFLVVEAFSMLLLPSLDVLILRHIGWTLSYNKQIEVHALLSNLDEIDTLIFFGLLRSYLIGASTIHPCLLGSRPRQYAQEIPSHSPWRQRWSRQSAKAFGALCLKPISSNPFFHLPSSFRCAPAFRQSRTPLIRNLNPRPTHPVLLHHHHPPNPFMYQKPSNHFPSPPLLRSPETLHTVTNHQTPQQPLPLHRSFPSLPPSPPITLLLTYTPDPTSLQPVIHYAFPF